MAFFSHNKDKNEFRLFAETTLLSRLNGKQETLFCSIVSKVEPLYESIMKTNKGVLCTVEYSMYAKEIFGLELQGITRNDKYAMLHKFFSYLYEEGLSLPVINFEAISKSPSFKEILTGELKTLETNIKPISRVAHDEYVKLVTNVINLMVLFNKGDLVNDSCIYENTHSFNLTLTSILYECLVTLLSR